MKRTFLFLIIAFCAIGLFAQMKVYNDGRVGIGGNNLSDSRVQINITEGENTGFRIFDPLWYQTKFKITSSEAHTYLSGWAHYPNLSMAFTGDAGINIGEKPYLTQNSGGLLNVFARNTYGYNSSGIYLRTTNNVSIGIYSSVDTPTKLSFASGLISQGSYNFYVRGNGEAYTQGVLVTSDSLLKQDIQSLSGSLHKVLQLRGVMYRYKDDMLSSNPLSDEIHSESTETPETHQTDQSRKPTGAINGVPAIDLSILTKIEEEDKNKMHFGLLAQEVEKVAPEIVRTSINGTKAIAYTELIALLIESIKEQQTQIEELSEQLKLIEKTPKQQVSSHNEDLDEPVIGQVDNSATLYQNAPNPFSQRTQIRYCLPNTVKTAYLCVYDLQGKQLKQYRISERGNSSQAIDGSEFSPGIYLYALLADSKEVDVKRMILTE